jgi:uncharacterized membrane protein YoaK (UPF0700 family)
VRVVERDVRLLVLAVSAGSADGWSYLGLGHAFVANMTGNTVLLGIAVFQNHGDLLHPAIALCGYAAGAMLGSAFTAGVQPGMLWSKAISWTLMLEALLLLAAGAGWATHAVNLNLLLGMVALGVGLQSGALVALKIPGVVTTYITGTWTTLLTGIVRFARKQPKPDQQAEERMELQAGVLAAYFLSAVLTGWLFRHFALAAGALPALSLLIVAVHGIVRG